MDQFWFYFNLGLHHVLDINAYDHVLFLIALTVPYTFKDWKHVLLLVTIFTVGHTLSLFLSVFGIVNVSVSFIEFLIPVTILITALLNIFTAGKGPRKEKLGILFFITLFFGLIHGLGFSNYFRQIIADQESKALPLIEFALGIETAQIIVVMVVLLFSFIVQSIFRFNKKDWMLITSSMVIGIIIPMLLETYPF
ncbi:HupE/UreJ family protein [Imtechella halotolerans]|uniref:HupE / UreJ protein n=1 Tax=Imtechella halotolerans K1 TaxID=946077 RepID=I0WHL0_9FLAO|nr:HupE/UreJ family protein [Imtechella halotolerans]EID75876.1 hypothetical protein W5A_02999 [Imtechella halotolerans K1]WMQ63065.1 HupE/UreJ family protein [Imtechella halotolerans]